MKNMKKSIAIIFGGNSSEHDVSLSSATSVVEVVDMEKYNITYVAVLKNGNWIVGEDALRYLKSKNDEELQGRNDIVQFVEMTTKSEIDLVLPILHGAFGEDGRLQGFLDILGVSYVFSSHSAHMLGMDKGLAKEVVAGHGVNIVPGILLHKDSKYDVEEIVGELGEALFVKPNKAGSSVGISKVASKEGLVDAIKKAFRYDNQVIVEKEIRGRELTVAIVEDENGKNVLPIIEITANLSEWYDYKSKYEGGGSDHVCPANIPKGIEERARKYASKAFESVGCKNLARVDILYDENDGEIYFLEINTIPGMTSTSLVPDAAHTVGISFEKLLDGLIENNL